ncbi:AsmA family protein [Desulfofustis glycolicus]|uniref:AsmA protein n=1 Tax=Desulfofustis glycolicus DSM 9705 TaxID=1121409 RepID=A0A1M5WR74_9BACT|nr:AsmA family protein [Desulfofustis glycolicus]MCB2218332.1 AsmA family protein [Desulfobulbaceae bacterium]SHH90008.1 AsmA protein [Desulfofustis glycolicus DSM 9705]
MKRVFTYGLFAIAALILLLVGAVLIVPRFLDLQRYTPTIEKTISKHTGMPAHLNGEITLSLFPWIALTFEDLQLDGPSGSGQQPLLQVRSFEARLKTLPLLTKNIEISRFIIDGPQLYLEKDEQGGGNWQKQAHGASSAPSPTATADPDREGSGPPEAGSPAAAGAFQLNSLEVAEFSLKNGSIRVVDRTSGTSHEMSAINLQLNDVSLDRPISLNLEALFDNQPLRITGSIGPLGAQPGSTPLPIDLNFTAFDTMKSRITGSIQELVANPSYQFDITVDPFNPKQLIDRVKPDVSLQTADPQALENFSLKANLRGTAQQLEVADGTIVIDDTTLSLERMMTVFAGPRIDLAMTIDRIDLDRYLPPASADQASRPSSGAPVAQQPENTGSHPQDDARDQQSTGEQTDTGANQETGAEPPTSAERPAATYESLRNLVLTAVIKLGEVRVHGATATSVTLDLSGEDALFTLNSLALDLYEGHLSATGSVDLGKNVPASSITAAIESVQVGPLLRDFADKDLLEGRLTADLDLAASGDRSADIVSSLNGTGTLHFNDGALIGLDLARLARTITSGFSLDEQGERPRTDFSELNLPVTIAHGLITIPEATLKSPFIRADASGTANLVTKTLDLRLRPELVATIKGQGDEEQRSGLAVPVLVGGTFSDPTFLPDLEALAREQLLNRQDVQDIIKDGTITPERREQLSEEVEKAKGLLKGLFGN